MDHASWRGGFLAGLSPQAQTKVLSLAQPFHYLAGETIFREGEPTIFLYLLKSGHVALEIPLPSEGRLVLTILDPGDIFSWSALSESRVQTSSARAIDEVEVLGMKGGALQDLCCENPQIGIEIYRILTGVISARLAATCLPAMGVSAPGAVTASSLSR